MRVSALLCLVLLLCACVAPPIQDTDETPLENYWRLVEVAEPVYPTAAREAGIEGHVLVQVRIGRQGVVQQARVLESEPGEIFVPSVMRAIHTFRYEATDNNPDRRSMYTEYRFDFELDANSND
ncbi:energy transducer TonB [Natronospira bacteriovora]|uniref:Protein TonB n=1 Tax=Natronospira bacteriovora TaxID=3069753 RepID=A0ABU0W6Y6_9GAMM|nr:energy transducer TonB [Natronospira sp. AB-CW4]MDQ2069791.1 energy transducer TonB [Natronospira sp. AB-CW4]